MAENTGLKDRIIQVSRRLFMTQGYGATSIKQIADGAGCTTAALYYYFKSKPHILSEVIHATIEVNDPHPLRYANQAETFGEWFQRFSEVLPGVVGGALSQQIWLITEFPTFGPEEQQVIRQVFISLNHQMQESIRRFVDSDEEAKRIAWTLHYALVGYALIYVRMGISNHSGFPQEIAGNLADLMSHIFHQHA